MQTISEWVTAGAVCATSGAFAWGAVAPSSQLFGPTIRQTGSASTIALTFDDGPNPAVTPSLLELLSRYNVKATFFLIGERVRAAGSIAREIAAQGHTVGNHSYTHPALTFRSAASISAELDRCDDAIEAAIGQKPRWMRPPFGFRSPLLGGIVRRRGGAGIVMWSRWARDWSPQPSEAVIRRLRPAGGGDIVLLHDGDHRVLEGDRHHTVAALAHWLPRWKDAGLHFVTLDDLARTDGRDQMDEKKFYDEKEETKELPLVCPHCRLENTYPVRWMVRTKKAQIPPGANAEDKKHFAKARSYMVRVDNMVACRNIRCRKRFELTGQSVFLI